MHIANKVKPCAGKACLTVKFQDRSYDDPIKFLVKIASLQPKGWMCLSRKHRRTGVWIDDFIYNRKCGLRIAEFLDSYPPEEFDLYFSVSAFRERSRKKQHALESRISHVDIDAADPYGYQPPANIIWETSPGRSQGMWTWIELRPPENAEAVSRNLVNTGGGDRGGQSCTKALRIPGTINHKPQYDRPRVKLLKADFDAVQPWPEVPTYRPLQPTDLSIDPAKHDWRKVVQKFKPKIRPRYWALMLDRMVKSPDRSRCIWMIVAALRAAGASPDEIASVVWVSPYFQSRVAHQPDALKNLNEEMNRILSKLETKLAEEMKKE